MADGSMPKTRWLKLEIFSPSVFISFRDLFVFVFVKVM